MFTFLTTFDVINSFHLCIIATRLIGQMLLGPFYQRVNWVLKRLWQDHTFEDMGVVDVSLLCVSLFLFLSETSSCPLHRIHSGIFWVLATYQQCTGDSMLNSKVVVLNKKPTEELKTNKKTGNDLNCDRWKSVQKAEAFLIHTSCWVRWSMDLVLYGQSQSTCTHPASRDEEQHDKPGRSAT